MSPVLVANVPPTGNNPRKYGDVTFDETLSVARVAAMSQAVVQPAWG